ncbi:MAG: alkyl hydroperoxide reductase [Chloroflexi bacterium]|nr:alkyl hydroperoxide reductase [Chloroflexota bacterium]MYF21260.1 alkyl hydroperoxide reductase [Chloroflexota bacterium]
MLPQLRKLERRYADTLQVVSVHSPKFPTERETENLRQAILRLRIEHPVLNDADFKYWQTFGARAWPTLYFIDPRGNVIGIHEGELTEDMAAPLIDGWLAEYEAESALTRRDLGLVRETGRDSALSFPGKVAWDDASGRLVVSDSNNDRIIISDLDGNVSQVIGGSEAGFRDGLAGEAQFNQPQGVEIYGDYVFVADNENHAIRRIDLRDGSVSTIAGTGAQARMMPQGEPARQTALSSPWDVAVHDGDLYIAMAGIHQIWRMPLGEHAGDDSYVGPWGGSGREGIVDGPRMQSELAQVSGLAPGRSGLAFADSESSGVREISWDPDGRTTTFIGKTGQGGLFHFGDADGGRAVAKLQHPLDVARVGDELYVADTFNHKIKQVFPLTENVNTLVGGHGDALGSFSELQFDEPGGLTNGPGRSLLVADTNNHRIVQLDLETRQGREIVLTLP